MTADGFDAFCTQVLAGPTWPGDLPPATLAKEFVRYFALAGFPRFEHLDKLVQAVGVGHISEAALPAGLRGVHYALKGRPYTIHYRDDDWEGGKEHTVLHEAYEILQEKFQALCSSYTLPQRQSLCRRADRFAAAVLMQPEVFALFAQVTGVDVVALQRMYRRSYGSIALRLTEVMHAQPMLVAVYDRWEDGEPGDWRDQPDPEAFEVGIAAKTLAFQAAARGRHLRPFTCPPHLAIRRGSPVLEGSAAWRVVCSGRPVHVERVRGYDLWGIADLTVAARPVWWHGKLAKVALVAVPYHDRQVLAPQLAQGPLERVSEAFQLI